MRFGAGMVVPLQSAAAGCHRCRCRVLPVPLQGAASGFCCQSGVLHRILLSDCDVQ